MLQCEISHHFTLNSHQKLQQQNGYFWLKISVSFARNGKACHWQSK